MELDYRRLKKEAENSTNPKWHRTMREEDLSFAFQEKHGDRVGELEDEMWKARSGTGPNAYREIYHLERAHKAAMRLKNFCYRTKEVKFTARTCGSIVTIPAIQIGVNSIKYITNSKA